MSKRGASLYAPVPEDELSSQCLGPAPTIEIQLGWPSEYSGILSEV